MVHGWLTLGRTVLPPNASFQDVQFLSKFFPPLWQLTPSKPCLDMLWPMPNQSAAANAHHLAAPFPGPQPWEAPDPLPVMRRELKLLLIEMNVLRVEVEQLRAIKREARDREEFLTASVNRLMDSRDHWRREAERLRALVAQVPPWSLFWWHCVDAFKVWRKPTDLHCA
jgi:FtsZ-binding cell division protein ZapB